MDRALKTLLFVLSVIAGVISLAFGIIKLFSCIIIPLFNFALSQFISVVLVIALVGFIVDIFTPRNFKILPLLLKIFTGIVSAVFRLILPQTFKEDRTKRILDEMEKERKNKEFVETVRRKLEE